MQSKSLGEYYVNLIKFIEKGTCQNNMLIER